MTDTPASVAPDPRPVLMMGDEPDTVAELMRLADAYADAMACHSASHVRIKRQALLAAIRAALNGDAA